MQQEGVMSFSVIWRGKKFVLEMNPSATLKELGNELQKQTNVRTDTMRLIVSTHKNSKMLYPFAEEHSCLSLEAASILEGKSIRMMGVPQDEVDEVLRNAKVDHRIAGFDEEEKRMRKRMLQGQQLPQLPRGTYIFCDFQTLHIPGIELNPPASEALKLMHRLAADPGIVAIMNKHRWRVGIMTEMAPVGYVGVSPKCILGFNKNHGEEISLRLRTDDLRGFRKYERIKMTLLHELAHMVHSEHDENFHALDKQLNEEAAALDWSKSRSHTLSGVKYSQSNEEGLDIDSSASLPRKLGGQTIVFHNARASSVAAAYHRLASASVNLPEASVEEPDPDNGGFDEFDAAALEKKELNFVNIENPEKLNYVLKLDDQYYNKNANKSESEPDPDDSLGCESMKPEPHTESGESRITSEPDPDDCHSCESVKPEPPAESGQIGYTFEPDPDDSEITIPHMETELGKELEPDNWEVSSVHGTSVGQHASESMDVCSEGNTTSTEPDSHESQGVIIQPKAEHDDMMHTMGKSGTELTDEPVLDDQELQRIQDSVSILCSRLQKAIEMLRSEVNPTEATMVLQTLLKIVRNIIERPDEVKFKRLRKANPVIQRNILDYRAAVEIISLIGFTEDVIFDEFGKAETYFVLKHNDPGRLWLAKSSLETHTA